MLRCIAVVLLPAVLWAADPIRAADGTDETAGGTVEIVDGRTGRAGADVTPWERSPLVLQAIDSARSYWSALDPAYEEYVEVKGTATGAFTEPGVQQRAVLYLMSRIPRGFPKLGLAILEGDRLVRNIAFTSTAHTLWAVPDIDGDGRDEIVFAGMFMMGGQVTRGVTLASFGEDGVNELGSVVTYESACGAGYEGSSAVRISVVRGSEIMIERFEQPSCESETWERVGEPEPLVLVPDERSSFADIRIQDGHNAP
jgi:hypothetical protein